MTVDFLIDVADGIGGASEMLGVIQAMAAAIWMCYITGISVFFNKLILMALPARFLALFVHLIILVMLSVNIAIYTDATALCCLCDRTCD